MIIVASIVSVIAILVLYRLMPRTAREPVEDEYGLRKLREIMGGPRSFVVRLTATFLAIFLCGVFLLGEIAQPLSMNTLQLSSLLSVGLTSWLLGFKLRKSGYSIIAWYAGSMLFLIFLTMAWLLGILRFPVPPYLP